MNTRPVAAAFFVAFCLLLCGLILRRQIAAHPLPPDARQQSNEQDLWMEQDWQPASPAISKQAQDVVQAEIAAVRDGEAARALSYRSEFRGQVADPGQFLQIMLEHHPEMRQGRTVRYGPVGIDPSGQTVWVLVLLRDRSGQRTRDNFLLVREGGVFKISRVQTQPVPN